MVTTVEQLKKRVEMQLEGSREWTDDETAAFETAIGNAYNLIVSALVARGISRAKVDTWLRLAEFESDIAMYNISTELGVLNGKYGDNTDWLKRYDRRTELQTVPLVDINGVSLLASGRGMVSVSLTETNRRLGIYP